MQLVDFAFLAQSYYVFPASSSPLSLPESQPAEQYFVQKLEHLGLPLPSFWEVVAEGRRAVDEARLHPLQLVLQICQASVDHFRMNLTRVLAALEVHHLLLLQVVLGLLGDLEALGILQIVTLLLSQLC